MKERPTVYVLSEDDEIMGVYYERSRAILEAEHLMTERDLDRDDWALYFLITKVTAE